MDCELERSQGDNGFTAYRHRGQLARKVFTELVLGVNI
jgi:hypothetical protein